MYRPIQVGSSLSRVDLGFLKDDTGENISEKNREYCELTALYWMWRNPMDADYVGLCHYRRYFADKVTPRYVRTTLSGGGYDVITCKAAVHDHRNIHELCLYIGIENYLLMTDSLLKLHPECYEAMSYTTFFSNKWTPCNMFIASREWTNGYCQWLFPVLRDVERRMRESPYARANRALGYMGEYLLGVYLRHTGARVRRVEMLQTIDVDGEARTFRQQQPSRQRCLYGLSFNITMLETRLKFTVGKLLGMGDTHVLPLLQAGVVGLKADGIGIPSLLDATEKIMGARRERKERIRRLLPHWL